MVGVPDVTRRTFLRGTASLAAVGGSIAAAPRAVAATAGAGSLEPVSMAMHVHAAFSEGSASMESHLDQAQKSGIDVLWWTEHDFRMVARSYPTVVHFDGLTEAVSGSTVEWTPTNSGAVSAATGSIVTSPASADDPGSKALRVTLTAAGSGLATRRYKASVTNMRLRTSLDGQTLKIDVFPQATSAHAFGEIRIITSNRPARGGRSSGQYVVTYRFGGGGAVGSRVKETSTSGVVTRSAPSGRWTTLTLDPVRDMGLLWPGVDFRDAALYDLELGVGARQSQRAAVVFDHLRFDRQRKTASEVMTVQRSLMSGYDAQFPSVKQYQGMEVSTMTPHLNWFGNAAVLAPSDPATKDVALAVQKIHGLGGIASYNHPFGTSGGPYSSDQQVAKRRALASTLLRQQGFGADMLEVGYALGRAGVELQHYLGLWDTMSRNSNFMTGTGVSDDHTGTRWLAQRWNYVTWAWADSTAEPALLDALAAGRAWFGNPAQYRGAVDLLVDGYAPMGSVTVVNASSRAVTVTATDLPSGGWVDLVQGIVDNAGTMDPNPLVTRTTIPRSGFATGSTTVDVSTPSSRFVRAEVFDVSGAVVAYSNPVWLLREPPVLGVPPARAA